MIDNPESKECILVINGPNLNMLGKRDPAAYGTFSLPDVEDAVLKKAEELDVDVRFFQSNSEGEIISAIHNAMEYASGIVINAGAYTHYSYAILDALALTKLPIVEVHISNIHLRETFRHISVIRPACVDQICGRGINSYVDGLDLLVNQYMRGEKKFTSHNEESSLKTIRDEITKADSEILRIFNHRLKLISNVAKIKSGSNAPVYNPERESEILEFAELLADEENVNSAKSLMSTIMRIARGYQYRYFLKEKSLQRCEQQSLIAGDTSKLNLLIHIPHRPGSLAFVLNTIADYGFDLFSIKSRPVPNKPDEYAILLDILVPASNPDVPALIEQFSCELPFVKIKKQKI